MAHTLKGSVRFFGDTPAYTLSLRLEEMAVNGNLSDAESTRLSLEQAVAALATQMHVYLRDH